MELGICRFGDYEGFSVSQVTWDPGPNLSIDKYAKLIEENHLKGVKTIIHAPFWITICNKNRESLFKKSITELLRIASLRPYLLS